MSKAVTIAFALLIAMCHRCAAQQVQIDGPALFRGITLNESHIVFGYVDKLWSVERSGGTAQPLELGDGPESRPCLSPIGTTLAFTGPGNDVFITEFDKGAALGEPKQLTWHPSRDNPIGWTPDSKRVLFLSGRDGDRLQRLYSIGVDGLHAEAVPLPFVRDASISPNAKQVAYNPVGRGPYARHYQNYRGGKTSPLWIADLETSRVTVLADNLCNHDQPMWVGDRVFTVSDESGTNNLHVIDLASKHSTQLTKFEQYGITFAAHSNGTIAFIRDGFIYTYEIESEAVTKLDITLHVDASQMMEKQVDAADYLSEASISPDGTKLALEVRGDIVITDLQTGNPTFLTENSSGVADRNPIWAPDGKQVAWFCDESGEYCLRIASLDQGTEQRTIKIEESPTFYLQPVWSPDSQRIAFGCKRLGLWVINVRTGQSTRIDSSNYAANQYWNPDWSPCGRYLTYVRGEPNHLKSVFVYDTQEGVRHQVTHDMPCAAAVFDRNGKYLYFVASNTAPFAAANQIWGLLSAIQHAPLVTQYVFVATLQNDVAAPIHPLTGASHPEVDVQEISLQPIEFDGIETRIVRLPVPTRDFFEIAAGKPGTFYLRFNSYPSTPGSLEEPILTPLYRYDVSQPNEFEEIAADVDSFEVCLDGNHVLHRSSHGLFVRSASLPKTATSSPVNLKSIRVNVNPVDEWRQIYFEAWRLMRDYFYDENHHGQDLASLQRHYLSYLSQISRRQDLNRLIEEMLGHVGVSHLYIRGGDFQPVDGKRTSVGDLGAEFRVHDGRYRFTKIFGNGHPLSLNPIGQAAPLGQPGIDVKVGDYLLSVNGVRVTADRNLFEYLSGTSNKPTLVTVGPNPNGTESRQYTVYPIPDTGYLRTAERHHRNRQRVLEATDGRIAYIVVDILTDDGVEEFLRQYAAGVGKEGVIIDQRFSPGGITSDRFVQMLMTKPYHRYDFLFGEDVSVPTNLIEGPKVMLINEHDGSASETFPYMFKIAGAGSLVGKRTAGAVIGASLHRPELIDGGSIDFPNRAAFNPQDGSWLENHGVEPDFEVEWWPDQWRDGVDSQLEKAIEVTLKRLQERPPTTIQRPRRSPTR